jgi:hypothetical protein
LSETLSETLSKDDKSKKWGQKYAEENDRQEAFRLLHLPTLGIGIDLNCSGTMIHWIPQNFRNPKGIETGILSPGKVALGVPPDVEGVRVAARNERAISLQRRKNSNAFLAAGVGRRIEAAWTFSKKTLSETLSKS